MSTRRRGGERSHHRPTAAVPVRVLAPAFMALALCAGAGCASGEADRKKDQLVVRDLDLEGTRRVSARQIKKKIATEKTPWWPFARKRYFDPVTWQSDLTRIRRLYEARGHYQAEVISEQARPDGEGGVEIKATVSEGEPTRLGTLDISGMDALTADERAGVLEDLPVVVGEVFEEEHWTEAKDQLRSRLADLGYAQAAVDGQALVDVKTHQVALRVAARLGPRFRFGDIEVKLPPGAVVDPIWVRDEARIAMPEGELYSDQALEEAQRRVFSMGIFAAAKVTAGTADPARGRISVVVDAQEAPFRTLRTGGGVHIDQIRNEVRLKLEWTNRNFRGGMRRLTARSQVGWAFIPNAYAVASDDRTVGPRNGPIARLRLELEQPRLFDRPALVGLGAVELDRTLEQAYDSVGGRVAGGVVWRPRASLSVYPSYNLLVYWLTGPPLASASTAPLALGCVAQGPDCLVVLSYLEELAVWDWRDDRLEPRAGFYASLSLQEGGGPLQGHFTFLRVLPELRGYASFGEDRWLTLAGRLRVGALWPSAGQESAVVSRFFAGGGISMRGFSDRRLAPLLLAPGPTLPGMDPVLLTLPIGGNGMIDGSFELRARVADKIVLAAFVDFGQVTSGVISPEDVRHMLWAVGVGVRYLTPVGPIRLDLARRLPYGRPPPLYAIDQVSGAVSLVPYQVDDSCFGLGGSGVTTVVSDNLCVLHLSIGEAF